MKIKPIDKKHKKLLNKVRERVEWLRDHGEEDAKKRRRYFGGVITKESFAEHFGVKEGEIQHCFQLLNLEGLLSQPEKKIWEDGWTPDRYHIRDFKWMPKEDTSEFTKDFFGLTDCPICDKELVKRIDFALRRTCPNNCFHYSILEENQVVKIFDETFYIYTRLGKGQIDRAIHDINKKIKQMKKNNRYIAEILIRD